jgi:hypothetical protein
MKEPSFAMLTTRSGDNTSQTLLKQLVFEKTKETFVRHDAIYALAMATSWFYNST